MKTKTTQAQVWKAKCLGEDESCDIVGHSFEAVVETLSTWCQAVMDDNTGEWYAPFGVVFGKIERVF